LKAFRLASLGLLLLATVQVLQAQEFRPYPSPKVSETDWQTYLFSVQAAQLSSEERIQAQHLLTYQNSERTMHWAFTTLGHPAHPSWITRRLVTKDGKQSIQQAGYYAGSEADFERWFQLVLEQTRRRESEAN